MTAPVLEFLRGDPALIALFEAVEAAVAALGKSEMDVKKSQISWGNPLKFSFFSLPARSIRGRKEGCAILTLGLDRRVDHPKIFQAVEPYPGRWTHHILLTQPQEVDGTVAAWLADAYAFALAKRRGKPS